MLTVRLVTPADRGALLALSTERFGAPADAADWAWKYDATPHPSPSTLVEDGGRVLAHFGGWGTRYRGSGGDLPGAAAVDVMTARAAGHLGKGRLYAAAGEAFFGEQLARGVPFVFGFPNAKAGRVGEGLLGYLAVERAGQLARAIDPLAPRARTLVTCLASQVTPAHDALADVLHARAGWRADRSRAALAWRLSRPGARYRVVELHDARGRSVAYAALRPVMERALLVDLQLADEENGPLEELLGAAESLALPMGASRLAVRLPREGVLARRLTREARFEEETSDTAFTVRPLDPAFDTAAAARAFDYRFLDHDVF